MSDEIPEVGPWAHEKLEHLRKYLHAYTTILSTKNRYKYVYIDAFAGPGSARIRTNQSKDSEQEFLDFGDDLRQSEDARQIIDGSPRVALDLLHPFTHYVFVERDSHRISMLESLRQEYEGRRKIRIQKGDCNEYLRSLVTKVDWRQWRAVVFLDPFGMHVPWNTIASLASTKAIEVFLNFPIGMAIQRLLPRNASFTPDRRKRLDEYLGDPSWFDVVYPKSMGLFGEAHEKAEDTEARLVNWYRERLRAVFGYVSTARLVRNSHGGHLYFLVFAGPNKIGARIADDVLRSGTKV